MFQKEVYNGISNVAVCGECYENVYTWWAFGEFLDQFNHFSRDQVKPLLVHHLRRTARF
jgi:hypothetical protein